MAFFGSSWIEDYGASDENQYSAGYDDGYSKALDKGREDGLRIAQLVITQFSALPIDNTLREMLWKAIEDKK